MIKDLGSKLAGLTPVTKEDLMELVSSWGRKDNFVALVDSKYIIYKNIEKCEPNQCYDLSNLDVSEIDNFDNVFDSSLYNGNLSKWDVLNVESMNSMFKNSEFNNDSISNWDVYNVVDFQYCFSKSKFNGDLSNWEIYDADTLFEMFSYSEFNNDSLNNWYLNNVEEISYMFQGGKFCGDISNWNLDFDVNATCLFVDNENFKEKYGNVYSKNDFLKWLSERKLEKQNIEKEKVYIDIKSELYNNLSIDKKIEVLNNNINLLNKDFKNNSNLLEELKIKYSNNDSINIDQKNFIISEFEKKCREANFSLNEKLSDNQDELEKEIKNKSLSEINIDFDVFIK